MVEKQCEKAFKIQLMRDRSHFTPVYKSERKNYESRRPITAMQLKSLVRDGFTRLRLLARLSQAQIKPKEYVVKG